MMMVVVVAWMRLMMGCVLGLDWCERISDSTVSCILSKCRNLEALSIYRWPYRVDKCSFSAYKQWRGWIEFEDFEVLYRHFSGILGCDLMPQYNKACQIEFHSGINGLAVFYWSSYSNFIDKACLFKFDEN